MNDDTLTTTVTNHLNGVGFNCYDDIPRVWVTTYSKYNAGRVGGKWFELDDYADIEEFYDACNEYHKDETEPEIMFTDSENIPDGYICEHSISERVWDFLELEDHDREVVEAYLHHFGFGYGTVAAEQEHREILDKYTGSADTVESFAEEELSYHLETLGAELPDFLIGCIDFNQLWRSYYRFIYYNVIANNGYYFFTIN
jgi:antirestriction protein